MNTVPFQPEVKLKDRSPSILKTGSSASEHSHCSFSIMNEIVKVPDCVDGLMQDKRPMDS